MTSQGEYKPALFLDRDGVINIDHGYVYKPQDFEFVPGIFELCLAAQQNNYRIFVVTNQSGIGRGLYSEQDFSALNQWMTQQFKAKGITIAQVYYCPHHPEKAQGKYLQSCECRKPKPGMMLKAQSDYQTDPSNSIMIGDKISDLQAAKDAHIERRILFDSNLNTQNHEIEKQHNDLVSQVVSHLTQVSF